MDRARIKGIRMEPARMSRNILVRLLLLFCLAHHSTQTAQHDNEDSFKDLKNIILSKLNDMDYKLSNMDERLQRMDETIENDIKKEIIDIKATIVASFTGGNSSPSPTSMDMKKQIDNIEAQGFTIVEDIKSMKQDRNLFNTAINVLTLSSSSVSTKLDNIDREMKQEMNSIKVPLEQIEVKANTTLREMRVMNKEINILKAEINNLSKSNQEIKQDIQLFNANLEEIKVPLKHINLQTNATLVEIKVVSQENILHKAALNNISKSSQEIKHNLQLFMTNMEEVKVVQDDRLLCDAVIKNTTLSSDRIYSQLDKIHATLNASSVIINELFRGDLTKISELRQNGPTITACETPWVSVKDSGCFLFIKTRADWDTARSKCQSKGGDLAILDTTDKRQAVATHIGDTGDANVDFWWIGANDRSGSWKWLSGEHITDGWQIEVSHGLSNVYKQPNEDSGDNTCIVLYEPVEWSGSIFDRTCTNNADGAICQK